MEKAEEEEEEEEKRDVDIGSPRGPHFAPPFLPA